MAQQQRRRGKAFLCPQCGEVVPGNAACCPECGSDENTGWSENTTYDDLDLPDPGWGNPQEPARLRNWTPVFITLLIIAAIFILAMFRVG